MSDSGAGEIGLAGNTPADWLVDNHDGFTGTEKALLAVAFEIRTNSMALLAASTPDPPLDLVDELAVRLGRKR